MNWPKVCVATVARDGRMDAIRRVRWRILGAGLGLVGTLVAERPCGAQSPAHVRFTDPHTIATATQTTQSGVFPVPIGDKVDTSRSSSVYVPPRCVGTRRCPLLVEIGGSERSLLLQYFAEAADTFGIIVLATAFAADNMLDSLRTFYNRGERHPYFVSLENDLKQVAARFAIDPDKIAIMGRSRTGTQVNFWGPFNGGVFSRIVANSTVNPKTERSLVDSLDKTTETLFISGLEEDMALNGAAMARFMRRKGHPATHVIGLRGHARQVEDSYSILHWLRTSWDTPNPAARPAPAVVAKALPALTPKVLTQMTTFWTRFQQEPESIKTTARRAHLREVVVPVGPAGEPPPSTWMVDMPALAAQHPSVAAALKQAGLTAQQHDAYRVALVAADYGRAALDDVTDPLLQFMGLREVRSPVGLAVLDSVVKANPTLAKNVELLRAHPDAVKTFEDIDMWTTP